MVINKHLRYTIRISGLLRVPYYVSVKPCVVCQQLLETGASHRILEIFRSFIKEGLTIYIRSSSLTLLSKSGDLIQFEKGQPSTTRIESIVHGDSFQLHVNRSLDVYPFLKRSQDSIEFPTVDSQCGHWQSLHVQTEKSHQGHSALPWYPYLSHYVRSTQFSARAAQKQPINKEHFKPSYT